MNALQKRLAVLLSIVEQQQEQAQAEPVDIMICLPIKDNELPREYQRGAIAFYVPEERRHGSAGTIESTSAASEEEPWDESGCLLS